jgi:hypothetical protein
VLAGDGRARGPELSGGAPMACDGGLTREEKRGDTYL